MDSSPTESSVSLGALSLSMTQGTLSRSMTDDSVPVTPSPPPRRPVPHPRALPSTSQHVWAPRSPWSNAGVPVTPGRGYRTSSTRWPTPGFTGSICGPGVITRADFSTPPQSQVAEFGGTQKLWHRSSRSNRFVDEGTQTNQEVDLYEQDLDNHSSVRSVTSAHSLHLASHGTAPVYQFDSFPSWRE